MRLKLSPDPAEGGNSRPSKTSPDPKISELVDTTGALEAAGLGDVDPGSVGADTKPSPAAGDTPPPVPGGNGIQSLDDALGAARKSADDKVEAAKEKVEVEIPPVKPVEGTAKPRPSGETSPEHPIEPKPPEAGKQLFEEFKLSPQARASTAQAFDALKTEAKRVVGEREAEVTKLRAKVAELEPLSQPGKLAPEVEKELTELRSFRDKLAPEGDPIFSAKYDAPIAATDEKLAGALRSLGGSEEQIVEAKKIGFDKLDWAKIFVRFPDSQRGIERLLNHRDDQTEARTKAARTAGENRAAWTKERGEELTRSDSERGAKSAEALTRFVTTHSAFRTEGLSPEHAKAFRDVIDPKVAQISEMLRSGDPAALGELAAAAALAAAQGTQLSGARALRDTDQKAISDRDAEIVRLKSSLEARDKDISALRKTTRPGVGGGGPSTVARGSDTTAPDGGASKFQSADDALSSRFGTTGDGR